MQVVSNETQLGLLEQTYESVPPDQETLAKARLLVILETLSNRDAFEIFVLALEGINATTEVLEEHQFSRKRYYVRLKRLVELGLVHKESKRYSHTSLGNKVYQTLIKNLEEAVSSQPL